MKWKLLSPRNFSWKMKTLESAKTSCNRLAKGSFVWVIHHDVIKQVSPEMLDWWFRNIGGEMEYQGKVYPKYLIWHPIDHIHWELVKPLPDGTVGVGSYFRIVEAFNGNLQNLIDTTEEVVKLDKTGIRLRFKLFGIELYSLEHQFIPVTDGTKYISRLQIGSESVIGKYLLNPFIQTFIFTKKMGNAWLKHNIEEVGNFEFFLPQLFQQKFTGKKQPEIAQSDNSFIAI